MVTITQRDGIWHLPVKFVVETGRETVTRIVHLTRAEETFTVPLSALPTAVQLDPGHDVLRWEPEYVLEPTPRRAG